MQRVFSLLFLFSFIAVAVAQDELPIIEPEELAKEWTSTRTIETIEPIVDAVAEPAPQIVTEVTEGSVVKTSPSTQKITTVKTTTKTHKIHNNVFGANLSPRVGFDIAYPFIWNEVLDADVGDEKRRQNLNAGLDLRLVHSSGFNFGSRFAVDLEDRSDAQQKWQVIPGIGYAYRHKEAVSPFARIDLPIIVRGAYNASNASDVADIGISGGLGLAFNILENQNFSGLSIRVDSNIRYTFGLKNARDVYSFEWAKVGIDYTF